MPGAPIPDATCSDPINTFLDAELVCFDAGPSPLMSVTLYDRVTGAIVAGPFFRDPLTGAAVVPGGNPIPCPDAEVDVELKCLCDDGTDPTTPFLRRYTYIDGVLSSAADFELDGSTAYALVGNAVTCGTDTEVIHLCDDGTDPPTPFLRFFAIDPDGGVSFTDTELDGITAYVLVGSAILCSGSDVEILTLCDDGTDPATPFLRAFTYLSDGTVQFDDFELDGVTPYVLVGSPTVCSQEISGPISVIPDPGLDLRAGRVNLMGAGSWSLGVDTGGGKAKSVTFRRRTGGTSGSVTVDDDFGNSTVLSVGESETWSVTGLEDELTGTLTVTTTSPGDNVVILWVEEV